MESSCPHIYLSDLLNKMEVKYNTHLVQCIFPLHSTLRDQIPLTVFFKAEEVPAIKYLQEQNSEFVWNDGCQLSCDFMRAWVGLATTDAPTATSDFGLTWKEHLACGKISMTLSYLEIVYLLVT